MRLRHLVAAGLLRRQVLLTAGEEAVYFRNREGVRGHNQAGHAPDEVAITVQVRSGAQEDILDEIERLQCPVQAARVGVRDVSGSHSGRKVAVLGVFDGVSIIICNHALRLNDQDDLDPQRSDGVEISSVVQGEVPHRPVAVSVDQIVANDGASCSAPATASRFAA